MDTLKNGVDNFKVSGYSIGGKDEDEGIVITGHVIVAWSGKAVIINSPFTRFNEDDATRYKFMDQLIDAVEVARNEAIEYVVNGKFKAEPQMELAFEAA